MRYLTRSVWILSIVSLLTDTASEMLYPVMPIYLDSIGFSVLFIGLLEGVAEAMAGLSKGYFGKQSDLSGKRVPFVQLGYALSAVAKPLLALFTYPIWVFFARTTDRFGKGIRTGARDAMLSAESSAATRGRVFGFHRAMDTFGAVLGPCLALVYLGFYPEDYQSLFIIAFIPGLIAVLATFWLKEKTLANLHSTARNSPFSFLRYWKQSPSAYRKLVFGLLLFALFNSSDMFLLLKAKSSGFDDAKIIGAYILYNLSYALFAFPMGILADRLGLKNIFILGLIIFSAVYFGMAITQSTMVIAALFAMYGLYAAANEGISKAWISNIVKKEDTATAIGTYAGFQSICSLLASSITGLVWFTFGAFTAFILTALVTLLLAVYFLRLPKPEGAK